MSEGSPSTGGQLQNAAPKARQKQQNPAFRMIGLPRFRLKLPSRNWMIFLTITGSFTGALVYDRRQKKRAQQRWCNLVAHISKEPLPVEQTRRRLTVFLAAPPGDGPRVSREFFQEYVKPILLSAAVDYEVVEGRKEGEVRAGLAEKIRKVRRKAGEPSVVVEVESVDTAIAETRRRMGVHEEPGPKGDLVIGRHTWKEYIRGLHEGWLGPLEAPMLSLSDSTAPEQNIITPSDDASPVAAQTNQTTSEKDKEPANSTNPPGPTPPYVMAAEYSSRDLPVTISSTFDGSVPIPFPHILGFLNTPIRIYRFFTRRYLADNVGREVAAIVLASGRRPYRDSSFSADSDSNIVDGYSSQPTSDETSPSRYYEQCSVLEDEEKEWHQSVYKKSNREEMKEREWLDDVIIDPRIASRMSRFILPPEEALRAERIGEGKEWVLGQEKPQRIPLWKRLWIEYGYGEDEDAVKRKPIIGNFDGEDEE